MEVVALTALLGLGYVLTSGSLPSGSLPSGSSSSKSSESFENPVESETPWNGGIPQPLYPVDKTPPGVATIPGKPRQPTNVANSESPNTTLSQFYTLPSSEVQPGNPYAPQQQQQPTPEQNLMYQEEIAQRFVSPITGLSFDTPHGNMTPFFRGSVKQNTVADANRSILDNLVGAGFNQQEKREQAPLFDPMSEPSGNVNGLESTTDFFHDRVVPSSNRAFERPVEPTRVGPGLAQGFSSLPIGGFQQLDVLDIARSRGMNVDDLRSATNPKLVYEGRINHGQAIGTQRGDIGEVRHYNPDRFYMNESGERNFVDSVAGNERPTVRSTNVMKFQAREETTTEAFTGPAKAVDTTGTYTTPSFRAPFTHQNDGYGYRNANGSTYGIANTDAPNNDYGATAYDLPVNQRNVTGERGQGLNVTGLATAPGALTVHDPNDVWRTTVRETTGVNDWIGGASAVEAKKLTVYDPSDIPRITMRNTNPEADTALNVTRAGVPGAATLTIPDGFRPTSKSVLTANSAYTGPGGLASAKGEQVYDTAYAMRQSGNRELLTVGRAPLQGNGVKPLFNGEDNVNMSYRKITADILNDRATTVNRVVGPTTGTEVMGLQRPKQVLHLDVATDRNNGREVLGVLASNPYAIPVNPIVAGGR